VKRALRLALVLVILAACGPRVTARDVVWSANGRRCAVSFEVANHTDRPVRARIAITVSAFVNTGVRGKGARSVAVLARETVEIEVPAGAAVRVNRELALMGFQRPSVVSVRVL
jgi:hypothetical protein